MSDTKFSLFTQRTTRRLQFDKDTDEWISGALSDDDINLPKDIDVADEMDEDFADLAEEAGALDSDDVWSDLGLEKFTKEGNDSDRGSGGAVSGQTS